MKKARFLSLALAGAITLMGAGYAYWTDAATINNTVTTGHLGVAFDSNIAGSANSDSGYVQVNASVGPCGKFANLDIKNLYPGASVSRTFTLDNSSTIPIKFSGLDAAGLLNSIKASDADVTLEVDYTDGPQADATIDLLASDAKAQLAALNGKVTEVGKNITFKISASMPITATDSQGTSLSLHLNPIFKQFNDMTK